MVQKYRLIIIAALSLYSQFFDDFGISILYIQILNLSDKRIKYLLSVKLSKFSSFYAN